MVNVLFLMPALLVAGCRLDGDREVDRSRFTFRTGDDTELFFKNVRQSDYDMEMNEAAKFNVFRHENRPTTDSAAWVNPAIVINYLQDEAYILIEPSPALQDLDELKVVHSESTDTLILQTPNREENLEFASRIYEHLQKGDSLVIYNGVSYVPFLNERSHYEAFRITLSDYYRLTRVY